MICRSSLLLEEDVDDAVHELALHPLVLHEVGGDALTLRPLRRHIQQLASFAQSQQTLTLLVRTFGEQTVKLGSLRRLF